MLFGRSKTGSLKFGRFFVLFSKPDIRFSASDCITFYVSYFANRAPCVNILDFQPVFKMFLPVRFRSLWLLELPQSQKRRHQNLS